MYWVISSLSLKLYLLIAAIATEAWLALLMRVFRSAILLQSETGTSAFSWFDCLGQKKNISIQFLWPKFFKYNAADGLFFFNCKIFKGNLFNFLSDLKN